MVQVENALKEKGKIGDNQFGRNLIRNLFDGKKGIKLRVPLGENQQEPARLYFDGVFAYYRNYLAHNDSRIDDKIALRILVIASDLLELINASELTLTDSGGVEGLVRIGEFGTIERLGRLLTILDGNHMPEGTYDGLFEDLARGGFDEKELEAAFVLDLIEMHSANVETTFDNSYDVEFIEWFELTDLGREVLQSLKGEKPDIA